MLTFHKQRQNKNTSKICVAKFEEIAVSNLNKWLAVCGGPSTGLLSLSVAGRPAAICFCVVLVVIWGQQQVARIFNHRFVFIWPFCSRNYAILRQKYFSFTMHIVLWTRSWNSRSRNLPFSSSSTIFNSAAQHHPVYCTTNEYIVFGNVFIYFYFFLNIIFAFDFQLKTS